MGKGKRVPVWAKQPESPPFSRRGKVFWNPAVIIIGVGGLIVCAVEVAHLVGRRHLAGNAYVFGSHAGDRQPLLLISLLFAGIVVIWLLWKLPQLQVARSRALTDENRFDRENEARKTLAQILAGVFVLAGLYSSVQTFDLSREGQITDRFTKAIEQLGALDSSGNPKIEVRLGGIYALERIARDSDRDYGVIMEVLTAYVRKESPRDKFAPRDATRTLREDIQAILTVIGRREANKRVVINLTGANLFRAELHGADLSWAGLGGTDLRGAQLSGADLSQADLNETDLRGANLSGADLSAAFLLGATLNQAQLDKADLHGAELGSAELSEANLRGANLSGADLLQAHLHGAYMQGANLSKVSALTWEQVDSAWGNDSTKLPPEVRRPARWPKE
jgi:hypothetical protein